MNHQIEEKAQPTVDVGMPDSVLTRDGRFITASAVEEGAAASSNRCQVSIVNGPTINLERGVETLIGEVPFRLEVSCVKGEDGKSVQTRRIAGLDAVTKEIEMRFVPGFDGLSQLTDIKVLPDGISGEGLSDVKVMLGEVTDGVAKLCVKLVGAAIELFFGGPVEAEVSVPLT